MSTQGDLAGLDRLLVSLPDWEYTLGVALALGALAGVPFFGGPVVPGLLAGVVYVGLPTAAAGVVTALLDGRGDASGDVSLNRSCVLALVCEVVVLALWFVAWLLASAVGWSFLVLDTVVAALAFVVGVRALVLVTVSRRSVAWTTVTAGAQSALALVLPALSVAFPGSPFVPLPRLVTQAATNGHPDLGVLVLLSALYVLAAYAILHAIDRPVRQSLEVTSLDFAHGVFRYLSGQPAILESFFAEFGDDAEVPVSAVSFRRADGTEKARVVVPAVHPGPMGDVGGGSLPVKLASAAEGTGFPLHGTAGHDFNPVSQSNVDEVVAAVDRALADGETASTATAAVRATVDDASVLAQRFGSTVLAVTTFAPEPADDVGYGVGLVMRGGLVNGEGRVALADAHNSNDGAESTDGFRHVTVGSRRARALEVGANDAGRRLESAADGTLRVGVAERETAWGPAEGVGPLGVRVAVVEAGGHRTAYVLADANNAEIGFREHVREAALAVVDEAELLTTDTHLVTQTTAVNQLGGALDWDAFRDVVSDAVSAAAADAEPVVAAGGETTAMVQVFGRGRTEQFASLANVMVAVGLALFGLALVVAIVLNVVVFVALG